MSKTKKTIDALYCDLDFLCQGDALMQRAFDAALKSEREHRRFGARFTNGAARYRESATTAAKYFVMKWFCEPRCAASAKAAIELRADVLAASALRESLRGQRRRATAFVRKFNACALDYVADIAG